MFSKENLHHAYFIEGDPIAVVADLEAFLLDAFNIERQGHPDVHYVEYESFGIDEGRGIQEMQSLRPIRGDRKIFILVVRSITGEAQNSLLKVFEEPTEGTHFFIVSGSQGMLLPTLRSRMILVVHPSARMKTDESLLRDAKRFISMAPKARFEFIAPMVEERDREKAEGFVRALISFLTEGGIAPSRVNTVKELLVLASYLRDRASSLKLVLERTALLNL